MRHKLSSFLPITLLSSLLILLVKRSSQNEDMSRALCDYSNEFEEMNELLKEKRKERFREKMILSTSK